MLMHREGSDHAGPSLFAYDDDVDLEDDDDDDDDDVDVEDDDDLVI